MSSLPSNQKLIPIGGAAKLLGVSLDTVRRWDNSGKLHSVRPKGKDRYFTLAELMQLKSTSPNVINPTSTETKIIPETSSPLLSQWQTLARDCLLPNHNDQQIYHIFEGVLLFGLGFIFIITYGQELGFSDWANDWFYFLGALTIMFAGLARLVTSYYQDYFARYAIITKSLMLIVEGGYVLIALIRGHLDLVPFMAALFVVNLIRLVMVIASSQLGKICFIRFSFYPMALVIIGGLTITFAPDTFPFSIPPLINYIAGNKFIIALVWFITFIPLLLFSISPLGINSRITAIFFSFGSILAFLIATQLAIDSRISLAYSSYLTGAFIMFVAWWTSSDVTIPTSRSFILFLGLIWIATATFTGLFGLKTVQDSAKRSRAQQMITDLFTIQNSIDQTFATNATLMRSIIQKQPVNDITKSDDTEAAVQVARQVYDQGMNLRGVNFVDVNGIAIGNYPRNPMIIGTDFSSRDYFTQTRTNLTGIVGDFFINILGNPNLVQTEPFFVNNEFAGLLAASIDLEKFSTDIGRQLDDQFALTVVDANQIIIFNTQNPSSIGSQSETATFNHSGSFITSDRIIVHRSIAKPAWDLYLTSDTKQTLADLSYQAIFLTILLVVNGSVSLAAAVNVIKKQHGNT